MTSPVFKTLERHGYHREDDEHAPNRIDHRVVGDAGSVVIATLPSFALAES
jgi:hypothetical protein